MGIEETKNYGGELTYEMIDPLRSYREGITTQLADNLEEIKDTTLSDLIRTLKLLGIINQGSGEIISGENNFISLLKGELSKTGKRKNEIPEMFGISSDFFGTVISVLRIHYNTDEEVIKTLLNALFNNGN